MTATAPVLLPYQQALLRATDEHQVLVAEKSRRIGYTWGVAAKAALVGIATRSAGGKDVLYIGYNREMAQEFVDVCAMWARAYSRAAVEVHETVFRDQVGDDSRDIQAFRIHFASGFEVLALSSRPRSLRGRQGFVIIDEAAFHDDLAGLMKAALALLMWGGQVVVISTHDGDDNPFNELVKDIRAGKRPYGLLRVTFDDAIGDGLFERICLVRGKAWSKENEEHWVAEIRSYYGDDAAEELDCIPRRSGGKYLSRVLLESRAADMPVLRWKADDKFVDLSDEARARACQDWLEENVAPLIEALPRGVRSFMGEDFGRTGDLSIQWPLLVSTNLSRRTPFVVELRNIPFREQEQVLLYLCEKLPGFSGAALDARGNGQYLAERARQKYGAQMVAEVMLTENWYREHMPRMKGALEDNTLNIPKDAAIVDDFRTLEVIRGVPRVAEHTNKPNEEGKKEQRHGDAAVACCLAYFASEVLEGGQVGDWSVADRNIAAEAFGGFEEREVSWQI